MHVYRSSTYISTEMYKNITAFRVCPDIIFIKRIDSDEPYLEHSNTLQYVKLTEKDFNHRHKL